MAAWDATTFDGTGLLDRVGSNLLQWPNPNAASFNTRSIKGKGSVVYLQNTISLPTQYTLLLFLRPTARTVFFSRSNTDQSAVWLEDNGSYYSRNDANVVTEIVNGPPPDGSQKSVVLVRGASTVSYFVNGAVLSASIPLLNCPDFLGRFAGWRDGAPGYSLAPDADFYAAGVWSGAATQSDVQALETALRLALVGLPATTLILPSALGRLIGAPPEALVAGPPAAYNRGLTLGWRNAYQGGNGRVLGTVKMAGTPNTPLSRKVRLIDETTGLLVREMWSTPAGDYAFLNVDTLHKYTVVAYDHTHDKRAVIADNITPELMP